MEWPSPKARRITSAVDALVVMAHGRNDVWQIERGDEPGAELRMSSHDGALLGREPARLEVDRVADEDLTCVVKVAGKPRPLTERFGKPLGSGDESRNVRDSDAVIEEAIRSRPAALESLGYPRDE